MANQDVAMERSRTGELIVMSPIGGISGEREAEYIFELGLWNRQTGLGVVFSSSTVFSLPGGGDRSPDAAWVKQDRWDALTREEQEKFPPICPDFVIELRLRTDRLQPLREKMQEYLASGLRLGWLINPQDQMVEIYRPQQEAEIKSSPATLSGDEVLSGFTLVIDSTKP